MSGELLWEAYAPVWANGNDDDDEDRNKQEKANFPSTLGLNNTSVKDRNKQESKFSKHTIFERTFSLKSVGY